MAELAEGTTPQGSTVMDAAAALEARWTAEEAANQEPKEEAPAEVPETEAPQEAEVPEEAPEESEQEPANVPTLYTVKVDGEERQVPVEELVKGYQFGADYTRKTQKLAEERRSTEAEIAAARQERALYAQLLPAIQAVLVDGQQPPDFDKLYQENPIEAIKQEREWRRQQEVVRQARAEQQRLAGIQQQEQQRNMQQVLAQESQKLTEAIPEWKDQKVAAAEKKQLLELAKKVGYSEDDVAQVTDHRAVVILRKAMLYDKMQATRATLRPAAQAVRTAPPNAQRPTQPTTELTKAKQRLAKTGTVRDAAAVIEKMLT